MKDVFCLFWIAADGAMTANDLLRTLRQLLHNLAMKRIGPFATMLFASVAVAKPAFADSRAAADVELADQQYNHALERADLAALREMIAEGYVFTDPTGRVTGRDELIRAVASGRIRITSQTTRDVHVSVFGNAAVETGLLTSVAVRDGRNSGGTFRFTRVWVRRGARWRTVAMQETVPEALEAH